MSSVARGPAISAMAIGGPRKAGRNRVRAREISTFDRRRKTRATPILPRNSPAARSAGAVLSNDLVRAIECDAAGWKVKYKETARGGLAVNVIEC